MPYAGMLVRGFRVLRIIGLLVAALAGHAARDCDCVGEVVSDRRTPAGNRDKRGRRSKAARRVIWTVNYQKLSLDHLLSQPR